MKIMIITPFYYPNIVGGAEISCQLLAEGLVKRGFEVSVLTYDIEEKKEVINGVTVLKYSDKIFKNIWVSSFKNINISIIESLNNHLHRLFIFKKKVNIFLDIFKKEEVDFIILNSNEEFLSRPSLWKAIKKSKIPNTLTFRDPILKSYKIGPLKINFFYRLLIKKQIKNIDNFTAPSKYMMGIYDNIIKYKNKQVIYNAVDMSFKLINYNDKRNIIMYAGNLREEKGVITLLKAFKLFNEKNNDFKLMYVGRGILSDFLKNNNNVEVIDWVDKNQLYSMMSLAKCVVLPSQWPEAFGRTIIESVYNGTLPIGSRFAAIPEIISDDSFLFECGNYVDLSKKLERIAHLSPDEYDDKIREFQKSFKKFSLDNYIESWSNYIILKEGVKKNECK